MVPYFSEEHSVPVRALFGTVKWQIITSCVHLHTEEGEFTVEKVISNVADTFWNTLLSPVLHFTADFSPKYSSSNCFYTNPYNLLVISPFVPYENGCCWVRKYLGEKYSAYFNSVYQNVKQNRLEWINDKIDRNEMCLIYSNIHCAYIYIYIYIYIYTHTYRRERERAWQKITKSCFIYKRILRDTTTSVQSRE